MRTYQRIIIVGALATTLLPSLTACQREGFVSAPAATAEAWFTECKQDKSSAIAEIKLKNTDERASHTYIVTVNILDGDKVVLTMVGQTDDPVTAGQHAVIKFNDSGLPSAKNNKLACQIADIHRVS